MGKADASSDMLTATVRMIRAISGQPSEMTIGPPLFQPT